MAAEVPGLTLVEFLLARIAEDKALAEAATGQHWRRFVTGDSPPTFAHVARHDPARVLVECEAKRQIVKGLVYYMEGDYAPWNEDFLRLLALPYADHRDYREEWRP